MITLNNINLSSIDLSGIDLRGIKLGLGGRGGGSGDGFPQLPGDVTRWHFGGLTNEMMAAMDDPRIEDADHKGRFLSFKNFAWSGMSGVGGYVQDFNYFRNNATVDKVRIDEQNSNSIKVTILTTGINNAIYIPKNIYQFNKSYFIKISSEGYNEGDLSLSFYAPSTSTATTVKVPLNPNGITEIPAIKEDDFFAVYLDVGGKVGSITIEQLPLYPGALVFDGVDDYGTCDNFPILTKEKGFTIVAVRQFISVKTSSLLSKWVAADESGAFIFEGTTVAGTKINSAFGGYFRGLEKTILSYMTSTSYNGNTIVPGNKTDTNNNLVVGRYYSDLNLHYANAAIWELVFLDHDATEEELTKIKDYFVKTYPWLFPDQAWTVAGKTNEDEDRATIANITGNDNDLVLSNFAFSGNSGYGLYNIQKFTNWSHVADRGDIVKNGYSVTITNSKITGSSTNYNTDILYSYNSSSTTIIFKVTGLVDGQKIFLGRKSVTDAYVIDKDGIYRSDYNIPQKDGKVIVGIGTIGFTGECNITIEQIPEYEGCLVTDGVDDKIVSSSFEMGKDFTIVGDWKFIDNKNSGTGLVKGSSFYIYNAMIGLYLFINSGSVKNSLDGIKSINAACSDGRAYDRNWNEILANTGNVVGSGGILEVSSSGGRFDRIAFKNLAIYPRILSKDDCIKAYNYLQTLKAK